MAVLLKVSDNYRRGESYMHTCQCLYVCSWVYRGVCLLKRKKKREPRRTDSSVLCTAVFIIALSVVATDSGSIQRKQVEDEGGAQ